MKKILGILALLVFVSCGTNNVEIEGNKIVKANGEYYLYYNKSIIKLTPDTYITKDKKVSDYFDVSLFEDKEVDFLADLKKYFPHGFNGIVDGEVPSEFIEIPLISLSEGKMIIDSVNLSEELSNRNPELLMEQDITKEENAEIEEVSKEVNLNSKKIAFLNANGIAGFAKKMGENLKTNLGIEFTAENYSKSEINSYIVNHKLNEDELLELIKATGLKYVKVLEDSNLKSDSDAVIIIGDDSKVSFDIEIISKSNNKEIAQKLTGYKLIETQADKYNGVSISDDNVIIYNKEDINIAKMIKNIIGEAILQEDTNLKNKIIITTK